MRSSAKKREQISEDQHPLQRLPASRRTDLVAYVDKLRQASVAELADYFNVSTDTIRRDLDKLNDDNILIRTHGGVISPSIGLKTDTSLDVRIRVQTARKEAIAILAANLVQNNSIVIMNAGSTILAVARRLSHHNGLTIATNNLQITRELQPKCYRTLQIFGGLVQHSSQATIGAVSFQAPDGSTLDIRVNLALIAVAGVSSSGYSINNILEASMYKEIMTRSDKVAILADSSKIGTRNFAQIAELGEADYFVTDSVPPAELSDALEKNRVQLITPS